MVLVLVARRAQPLKLTWNVGQQPVQEVRGDFVRATVMKYTRRRLRTDVRPVAEWSMWLDRTTRRLDVIIEG